MFYYMWKFWECSWPAGFRRQFYFISFFIFAKHASLTPTVSADSKIIQTNWVSALDYVCQHISFSFCHIVAIDRFYMVFGWPINAAIFLPFVEGNQIM